MKKKSLYSVAILATLSVFLAGCSSSPATTESEPSQSQTEDISSAPMEIVFESEPESSSAEPIEQIDSNAICSRLIGLGEGLGLSYDSSLTPESAGHDTARIYDLSKKTWTNETIYQDMKKQLQSLVTTVSTLTVNWKGTPFCPVLTTQPDGTYTGYILYSSVLNYAGLEKTGAKKSTSDTKKKNNTSSKNDTKNDKQGKENQSAGKNSKAGTGNSKRQQSTGKTTGGTKEKEGTTGSSKK